MSIKEHVSYNVASHHVYGLDDLGLTGRTKYVAIHADVFMVRGLVDKQKQTVGLFCHHRSYELSHPAGSLVSHPAGSLVRVYRLCTFRTFHWVNTESCNL